MYSFTHVNIVFLSTHLFTEIVISINACYQMKCFIGDSFSFLGAGVANIPSTFSISCVVHGRYSKKLKHSEQYIWDHLSGTKVKIWICSEYDAIFSCIASCNQLIHLLIHITFMLRIWLWIFQTVNFYFVWFFIGFITLLSFIFALLIEMCWGIAFKLTCDICSWLEFIPWCLTFSEFIVSICNRLNILLIMNTTLPLKKI